MRLVLFEPDIPQNTGAMLRLAACLGVAVDIVEPCGFTLSDRRLRRAGLDYLPHAAVAVHASWPAFCRQRSGRLVLLTTRGTVSCYDFTFRKDDNLILGRESAGAPAAVHEACDARVKVPMCAGLRSLNVALAAALALGEALRQTKQLPREQE